MKNKMIKLFVAILPCMIGLQGCHVSKTTVGLSAACPVAGPTAGDCTVTVTSGLEIVPNAIMQTVGVDDLMTTTDGSYTVSTSVPSGIFTADPNGTPSTTLTANTDTGYSSTIILALTPTAAAIAPVNNGDLVYSYNLPATPEFNSWVQQVAANTNSTMTLSSSAGVPLIANQTPGNYTITAVLTSNSSGTLGSGNMQLKRVLPPTSKCRPGMNCQA